jgi:hypothetical protein
MGGGARAATRRNAIKRAASAHRKRVADRPYPTALVLYQRLGVKLEDLGRLALALEAEAGADPFGVLRRPLLDAALVMNRLADLVDASSRGREPGPSRWSCLDLVHGLTLSRGQPKLRVPSHRFSVRAVADQDNPTRN